MPENKNNFLKQDKSEGLTEANESNKRHKRILTFGLIAVLLICMGIGCVFLFSSDVFSSNAQVTVSFDSTGGNEIENQTIPKGGALTEVGTPSRNGYMFAGWYYEEAPVNAYNADDIFSEDTTLYAGWYEPVMEVDKAKHIRDCDSDISFVVHSQVELTKDNLAEFIEFSISGVQDGKTLSVKKQDGGYLLYSEDGFTPGNTYSIKILDTKTVSFVKADEDDVSGLGITNYNFTVYKENINNVVMKAKPKLLSSDDVSSFEAAGEVADGETGNANDNGKTIYRAALVNDDGDYQVGDIISLGSGKEDAPENQYYKVIKVSKNNSGFYVDVITPNIDEIYSDFEMYYSGDAAYFEEDEEDTDDLEQSLQTALKESDGYDYICTAIARGIKESPTLRDTVATLDINNQKRFENINISALKDMLKNVKFDISFGKTTDLAYNDNGCYGRIHFTTGDITINLDQNIKLTLKLSMKEDVTTTMFGWYFIKNAKLYADKGLYLDNKFDMSFSAVIATSSGTVNITDEIQKLVNSQSDDKTQAIVDNFNKENLFGDNLDYVEILSKQLGEKTITVYEVLSIQFTLDFKVSVGMRAGLDLNFSSSELRKIGMCNIDYSVASLESSRTDMDCYNKRLEATLHFDATLKGKVGVRAGFEAGVNFSVLHLNKVFNFGFAAEVGVYEEISGYLRFDYDYEYDSGNSSSSMNMAGGLMSETGIYVELSFTWNIFGWDDGVTLAEMKFPILTIGALEFASEFNEPETAVTFDTPTYNIKNSGNDNLLKLKYVDISGGANGVTINVKPAPLSSDYAFYLVQDKTGKGSKDDLDYVSVDKSTGIVTIENGAPDRLDFTVVVQYTKGCSLFSKDLAPITKSIHFTHMKYKVVDSTKKYKATFYKPDGSVLEQKEYYVGQVPVPPADDTYDDLFGLTQYRIKSWSKPWKEEIKAIYEDISYHLDYELNYKNISFYGNVYNEATGKYEYGPITTVSTLFGEMPVAPLPEDMDIEPGWKFDKWSPDLTEADADYSYTATYKQDTNYCWTSFYTEDTHLISGSYVKKGIVPEAPDMSQYNTDERQFVGWWPSLRASANNSETYFAVFRKYVKVTFKDKEGKVLSEKRVLAGEKPEAPKIDNVIEGEKDYFEYHFNHWATEEGARIDQVYGNTVYSPVYDKHFLEVTTIFDAGDHTFADGTKTKEYKGTYSAYNFLYMPQVTYRDNENTYTVDYWQSTEQVNGSYVKLYMSDFYTHYKYNLTFTPVFKAGVPIEYTVRFDGGDKPIYVTGHYGDVITADMLSGLKKTSTTNNYVYKLRDYGLTLPYMFGTVLGEDGLPAEYVSAVAKFELVGMDKTFTFDANGGKFNDNTTVKTVTAPYGTKASFNEVPAKADDSQYSYTFAGWSDDKNATTGSSFSNFTINGDSTLYAVYTKAPIYATLTFYTGAGHFADGSTQKTLRVLTGSTAPAFNESPHRDSTADWEYTFTGWAPAYQPGTVVGSSASYYAQYSAQKKVYTVTFDAGEGRFAGGEQTITQNYNYGDTIVPPSDPSREGGTGYEYVFDGWSPSLTVGTTVTFNRTFTASYHLVGTGTIGETGIIVTKDGVSEDINVNGTMGVGRIPGYTCEMVDHGGTPSPTLTVTGNGLTFSGSSSEVYVVIAPSATDCAFNSLTLSGAYLEDGALVTNEATAGLTINISGNCVIRNTQSGEPCVRLERPVLLKGVGTGTKLFVSGKGNYTVYSGNTFSVDSIELEINGTNTALGNDESGAGEWQFTNSAISITSDESPAQIMSGIKLNNSSLTIAGNSGLRCSYIAISGTSNAELTASGENASALQTDGDLSFKDFTGTFSADSTHSTEIAVKAYGGIKFVEGGTEVGAAGYNLDGTVISSFVDADTGMPYSSFGIDIGGTPIPASTVTVTKTGG